MPRHGPSGISEGQIAPHPATPPKQPGKGNTAKKAGSRSTAGGPKSKAPRKNRAQADQQSPTETPGTSELVTPGSPAAEATRPPGLSPTEPANRDSSHSRAGTHESGTGPLRRRGFRPPPAISTRRLYPGMPSADISNSADLFSRTDLCQFPEESESEYGRLSGIPVADASPASTTSQATRNKKSKQKRRSSSSSDESRRNKTLRSHRKDVGQSVTPADFMLAFQNISNVLSALAQRRDGSNAPPVATFPNPRS